MTLYGIPVAGVGILTPEKDAELLLNRETTPSSSFIPDARWEQFVTDLFGSQKMREFSLAEKCDYTSVSDINWQGIIDKMDFDMVEPGQVSYLPEFPFLQHLRLAVGYPDEGSYFDQELNPLTKERFRESGSEYEVPKYLVSSFLPSGYDAIMAANNGSVIGHVAWQRRPDDDDNLHLFSVYVQEDKRKQGLGISLCERILDVARKQGVNKIRFGELNQGYMHKVRTNFAQRERQLGVAVVDDMYIEVKPLGKDMYHFKIK